MAFTARRRDRPTEPQSGVRDKIVFTALSSDTRTANGNSQATPMNMDWGKTVVFFLDVTAVGGTSPTLDLYVDIRDPLTGKWVNQDKFAQVTAVGTYKLSLSIQSTRYSLRWVLGGTTPSFTFSVGGVIA